MARVKAKKKKTTKEGGKNSTGSLHWTKVSKQGLPEFLVLLPGPTSLGTGPQIPKGPILKPSSCTYILLQICTITTLINMPILDGKYRMEKWLEYKTSRHKILT